MLLVLYLAALLKVLIKKSKHFSVQLAKTDFPLIAIQGKVDNYRLPL